MVVQSIFSYDTFVHSTAGSLGSMFAMSVFYPLDVVRFRKQLEHKDEEDRSTVQSLQQLVKVEGLSALYRGITPVLTSLGVSNFVYFYAFHGLKRLVENTAFHDLTFGMLAGATNVLVTTPLWVVNSRLKVSKQEHYSGLLDGLVHIAKTEGMSGLWSSLGPSLILVINPAIQISIYEALKRKIPAKTAAAYFLMGALAKMCATVVTYPLQLVQTRQRYSKEGQINAVAMILGILKRQGFGALFQGLEAKLLQTVLTAALMFLAYEKIVQYVTSVFLRRSRLTH